MVNLITQINNEKWLIFVNYYYMCLIIMSSLLIFVVVFGCIDIRRGGFD